MLSVLNEVVTGFALFCLGVNELFGQALQVIQICCLTLLDILFQVY